MKVVKRVGVMSGLMMLVVCPARALNQAGGYSEHEAWSSLQGPLFVTNHSTSYGLWLDDYGRLRWNFFINAAGLYGEPPPGSHYEASGRLWLDQAAVTALGWPLTLPATFQINWSTIANANWYTGVAVLNGEITGQSMYFGGNEDKPGTWQAGVWVQGIVAPEPSTGVLLLISLALILRPRGGFFLD